MIFFSFGICLYGWEKVEDYFWPKSIFSWFPFQFVIAIFHLLRLSLWPLLTLKKQKLSHVTFIISSGTTLGIQFCLVVLVKNFIKFLWHNFS